MESRLSVTVELCVSALNLAEEGIATILTENSKDFEGTDEIVAVNPFLD